ncbi:unnamed protein product, partial [Closterium sp. NIES-53]
MPQQACGGTQPRHQTLRSKRRLGGKSSGAESGASRIFDQLGEKGSRPDTAAAASGHSQNLPLEQLQPYCHHSHCCHYCQPHHCDLNATKAPTPANTPTAATTSATSTTSTAAPTTTPVAIATTPSTLALAVAALPTKSRSSPDIH